MREIKFRAWFVNDDEMQEDYASTDLFQNYGFFTEGVIPMQYTGLKDKNKKEIYEGDIVKENGNPLIFGDVVFKGTCFGYINRGEDYNDVPKDEFTRMHTVEVIGNIYSNPELL